MLTRTVPVEFWFTVVTFIHVIVYISLHLLMFILIAGYVCIQAS